MKKLLFLMSLGLIFNFTLLHAQDIINPVSATTTLSAQFGSNLDNTINGSGLVTFPSLSADHEGTNPGNAFYATNATGTMDFDLGDSFLVDGLAFWNANATGPPQTGIQDVMISSSEDGVTFTPIAGAPAVFAEATGTTSEAEQFSFDVVTASYIRVEVITNYGSGSFVGFAEVAFSGIPAVVIENVINPVSATTTLSAQFGSSLDNTINGSGLVTFPSLSADHEGTNPGNAFYATNATGTIDFDLGDSYLVDGLAFWNANATGPPQTGIQDVIVSSSEDGVTYTTIPGAPTVFSEATGTTSTADQFSFDIVTASYIRIEVATNYGSPDFIGFAEIAFSGILAPPPIENVINPVSATTTLPSEFGTILLSTIDGTGLNIFPSLSADHLSSDPANSWVSSGISGNIDFDLGGLYLVDGFSFWNQNAGGPGADGTTGIKDIMVYSSTDGATYTLIPGAPTTFAQITTGDSAPEQFAFTELEASFIRIEILNNHGDALTGFAEIAFSGIAAPLPENVINPVSATTTLSAQFGSNLDNAINGVGLDAFPSLSATHEATNPGNAFYAANAVGSIDFDLGGTFLVDGLAFWNNNAPGPGGTGIQDVMVSSSEDGVTFTPIAGSPTVFTQVMTPTTPAERFTFTEVTASYIRFEVLSNFDGSNLVGFAEVAFSGVPTLGVNDNVLAQSVSVYPNPARDFVTISNSTDVMINSIEIYDMNGRLVEQLKVGSTSNQTINVSELTTGMYLINITSDQATVVKRLIKK